MHTWHLHEGLAKTSSKERPGSSPDLSCARRWESSALISASVLRSPSRLSISNLARSARSAGERHSASSATETFVIDTLEHSPACSAVQAQIICFNHAVYCRDVAEKVWDFTIDQTPPPPGQAFYRTVKPNRPRLGVEYVETTGLGFRIVKTRIAAISRFFRDRFSRLVHEKSPPNGLLTFERKRPCSLIQDRHARRRATICPSVTKATEGPFIPPVCQILKFARTGYDARVNETLALFRRSQSLDAAQSPVQGHLQRHGLEVGKENPRSPARRPPALLPVVQSADTDAQQSRKFGLRQAELVPGRRARLVTWKI